MNPHELQKQLLIAESEINRARLAKEWHVLVKECYSLIDRAHALKTASVLMLLLMADIKSIAGGKPAPNTSTSSWPKKLFRGARLAITTWLHFCSRGSTLTSHKGV